MKLLVLDNYDSFTFNLVQFFGELGTDPVVVRNDRITVDEVTTMRPGAVVISPGPCTPDRAGISVPLVRAAAEHGIPLLGVCLGHQAIGEAFGGRVIRAERPMHGKSTSVTHDGDELFRGVPAPVDVMRYHSLIVESESLPDCLRVTAWSTDRPPGDEIMAMRHVQRPVWGVQFHPESVGTPTGRKLLRNFLDMAANAA